MNKSHPPSLVDFIVEAIGPNGYEIYSLGFRRWCEYCGVRFVAGKEKEEEPVNLEELGL